MSQATQRTKAPRASAKAQPGDAQIGRHVAKRLLSAFADVNRGDLLITLKTNLDKRLRLRLTPTMFAEIAGRAARDLHALRASGKTLPGPY